MRNTGKALLFLGLVLILGTMMGCGFKPEKIVGAWDRMDKVNGMDVAVRLVFDNEKTMTQTMKFNDTRVAPQVTKYTYQGNGDGADNELHLLPEDKDLPKLTFYVEFLNSDKNMKLYKLGADNKPYDEMVFTRDIASSTQYTNFGAE